MAFEMFQNPWQDNQDSGLLGGFPVGPDTFDIGSNNQRNAQTLGKMMGENLLNLGEIGAAKDAANKWREMAERQRQAQKKKGLFGGILDVASTALGFIPGIGTAAKIGIGLATQGAKSLL